MYQIDYQISLDQLSDLVFSLDVPGNVLYVNRAIERILGYSPDTIIGQHLSKFLTAESWQTVQRLFQSHIRFNREVTVPLSFIKADGRIAILEVKAVPIAQDNKIVAIQAICRDITEKVRLEEQLKQERWQAQVLYEITTILNQPLGPEDLAGACLDRLCEFLGVPIGHIRSFDPRARTAPMIVGRGLSANYITEENASPFNIEDSPLYTSLCQGNSLVIENFEQDPRLPRRKLLREGVKSAVYVPIKSRERSLLGFLALASREYNYFKPEILPFLESITSQMGIATERTLFQQRLARAKEKYQHIFTYANDLIYLFDLEGNFIEANLAAREFTGYGLNDRIHIRDILPPDKPEEIIKLERVIQQLLQGETTQASLEMEIVKTNGERAILDTRGVLLRDHSGKPMGFQGISRDITERKRLEKELRDNKEFLDNIIQNIVDTIIMTDIHGIVTFYHPGLMTETRYSPAEMLGQPLWKFYREGKKEAKKIMSILKKEGRLINYELELVEKGGKVVPYLTSSILLRDDRGEIVGTLGIAKDLTEKKALERQVFQSEKLASIGMLAGGAAHEIFNPMQVILGISQLLMQKQKWDDSVIEKLKKIEDQVKRVTNIINGLRQFSHSSLPEKTMLDLNATLKEALSLIEYDFPKEGIDLIVKLDPQPLILYGDSAELIQLFVNILINARDAMPKEGRVTITTAPYINQERNWVRIVISDTGCGIPPELLPKIFDPFFTTKAAGKGTGLGLTVCHGIVKRHDGLISVESQPRQGTTFTIDLPLAT